MVPLSTPYQVQSASCQKHSVSPSSHTTRYKVQDIRSMYNLYVPTLQGTPLTTRYNLQVVRNTVCSQHLTLQGTMYTTHYQVQSEGCQEHSVSPSSHTTRYKVHHPLTGTIGRLSGTQCVPIFSQYKVQGTPPTTRYN